MPSTTDASDLYVRIQAEFLEMPGLTMTVSQAARLFGIDPSRCERVLAALVNDAILVTDGSRFARALTGAAGRSRR